MTIPNDLWYTNSYTNHIHKTGDNFEQTGVIECLSHFEIHCAILTPVPRKIQQELIWLSTRPPSKRLGWKVQQSHVVSTCIILHHLVIPMPGKQHLFQQAWLTNDKRFFVAMVRKCGSSAWLSTEGVCMSNSHPKHQQSPLRSSLGTKRVMWAVTKGPCFLLFTGGFTTQS